MPGIASGAPAVLLAAVGAQTNRIRLGSGGVMLPHHQPLVVAEQFLMLQALYPARIDLGLGRTLGFTEPVRRALRQESDDVENFANDVEELRDYLQRNAAVTARPAAEQPLPIFLLATGRGISTAARLGLPVVIGGPILRSDDLPHMLQSYRREFRPSPAAPESAVAKPEVLISADVYIADTTEEAHQLALPEAWAMARSRETGEFGPLEPVEDIRAQRWSRRTEERIQQSLEQAIAGDEQQVANRLDELFTRTGASELLVSTSTYDRQALRELDTRMAGLAAG